MSKTAIVVNYTKRVKTGQSMKGIKKLAKISYTDAQKRADDIIKNTYRTLMTRGMKGCYIYCTNEALSKYLSSRLNISTAKN